MATLKNESRYAIENQKPKIMSTIFSLYVYRKSTVQKTQHKRNLLDAKRRFSIFFYFLFGSLSPSAALVGSYKTNSLCDDALYDNQI